jgi:hypothetical protein
LKESVSAIPFLVLDFESIPDKEVQYYIQYTTEIEEEYQRYKFSVN